MAKQIYKEGRYYTWHTWNTMQVSVITHSTGFTSHKVRNSSKNCFKKSVFSLQRANYISVLMKVQPITSRTTRLSNLAHCVLFQKYEEVNTKFQKCICIHTQVKQQESYFGLWGTQCHVSSATAINVSSISVCQQEVT